MIPNFEFSALVFSARRRKQLSQQGCGGGPVTDCRVEAEENRPLAVVDGVNRGEHHVGVRVRWIVRIEPRGDVDLVLEDLVEIGDGRIVGIGMRSDGACGGCEVEDLEVE